MSAIIQAADALRLRRIFADRQAADPSLTQQRLAEMCGWKQQSAVSQYLRGTIPLNFDALIKFCEVLNVPPTDISPSMGKRIIRCAAIAGANTPASQVGNFGDSAQEQLARQIANMPLPNYAHGCSVCYGSGFDVACKPCPCGCRPTAKCAAGAA